MKRLRLPASVVLNAVSPTSTGKVSEVVVRVDWFDRLTDDQVIANALASAAGEPTPYPDPNFITLEIERPHLPGWDCESPLLQIDRGDPASEPDAGDGPVRA